jgi:hypothetical protein
MSHSPTETEIAWAAGLFEGEGCISVHGRDGRYVKLTVAITDLDVLERFIAIAEPGAPIHKRRIAAVQHRQVYQWCANGRRAIPILEMFIPWFGERRRARALEALDKARALRIDNGLRTHCPRGHPYDEANTCVLTRGGRVCRACAREKAEARRRALGVPVRAARLPS